MGNKYLSRLLGFAFLATQVVLSTQIFCSTPDIIHILDTSGQMSEQSEVEVHAALRQATASNAKIPIDDGARYGLLSFHDNTTVWHYLNETTTNKNAKDSYQAAKNAGFKNYGSNLHHGLLQGFEKLLQTSSGMQPQNPGAKCRFVTFFVNGGETIRPGGIGVVQAFLTFVHDNQAFMDTVKFRLIAYTNGVSIADACDLLRVVGATNNTLMGLLDDQETCENMGYDERQGIDVVEGFAFVHNVAQATAAIAEDYSQCFCTTTTTSTTGTIDSVTQSSSSLTTKTTTISTETESTPSSTSTSSINSDLPAGNSLNDNTISTPIPQTVSTTTMTSSKNTVTVVAGEKGKFPSVPTTPKPLGITTSTWTVKTQSSSTTTTTRTRTVTQHKKKSNGVLKQSPDTTATPTGAGSSAFPVGAVAGAIVGALFICCIVAFVFAKRRDENKDPTDSSSLVITAKDSTISSTETVAEKKEAIKVPITSNPMYESSGTAASILALKAETDTHALTGRMRELQKEFYNKDDPNNPSQPNYTQPANYDALPSYASPENYSAMETYSAPVYAAEPTYEQHLEYQETDDTAMLGAPPPPAANPDYDVFQVTGQPTQTTEPSAAPGYTQPVDSYATDSPINDASGAPSSTVTPQYNLIADVNSVETVQDGSYAQPEDAYIEPPARIADGDNLYQGSIDGTGQDNYEYCDPKKLTEQDTVYGRRN
eukprot:m.176988 g.176988  ORF g.176988 m.176988 type:complete len:710 (+) comp15451_c1_seq5:218-2347(+)